MVDLRYHLASLIAVFIALGIGMLIGNSFVGLASVSSVEPQMHRIEQEISQERGRLQSLQGEVALLRTHLSDRDRALRLLAPRAVAGLLDGRRVALVRVGDLDHPDSLTDLTAMLAAAGAKVESTTLVDGNWPGSDPDARARILQRLGVAAGEGDTRRAARALARAIVTGEWSAALHTIAQAGKGLQVDGDYSSPVGAVVLVNGDAGSGDAGSGDAGSGDAGSGDAAAAPTKAPLEAALLDSWKTHTLRLVVAEAETASDPLIPYLRGPGIATVDNIDTALGQIACTMALVAGEGNYGTRPTADRILPELPHRETPRPVTGGAAQGGGPGGPGRGAGGP